ncbi:DUF1194 domain-containing protein [Mesorhizobium sp. M0276]|uniref:DUF1194 domain-containing protein n=2 Tax=unclassified Mesorhizobium TaxID=325217 RepID=UPI00333D1C4D
MQPLSAVLGMGLLSTVPLIVGQPAPGVSHVEKPCPCETHEKWLLMPSADEVDVAIVLAADMSGSINQSEAALEREGYASALESTDVLEVIKEGPQGKVAVTYLEWSSAGTSETRLDWAILSDAHDASFIAGAIRDDSERKHSGPHGSKTSISYAIDVSVDAFDKLPARASRRIIDISGDGTNNDGFPVEDSRRRALQKAIVINGLPIGHDVENGETIPEYYERHVIGGPGSFMVTANSAAEFRQAITYKLAREVAFLSSGARPGLVGRAGGLQQIETYQRRHPAGAVMSTAFDFAASKPALDPTRFFLRARGAATDEDRRLQQTRNRTKPMMSHEIEGGDYEIPRKLERAATGIGD